MSERPTPEQIAEFLDSATGMYAAEQFLDRLETEGYVIVHPDDVPEDYNHSESEWDEGRTTGWNACRRHIFGD